MQDKQSVFFTRPAERQQEARGKVVIHRLWPICQKEFYLGLRPLREF